MRIPHPTDLPLPVKTVWSTVEYSRTWFPRFAQAYGRPVRLLTADPSVTDGPHPGWAEIESATGFRQGDPLAGPGYCIALQPVLDESHAHFPMVEHVCIADDITILGTPQTAHAAAQAMIEALRPLGQDIAPHKSICYSPTPIPEQYRIPGFRVVPPEEGVMQAGIPIGAPAWVTDQCCRIVRESTGKLLQEIGRVEDDHVAYALIRYCANTSAIHLARAVPPTLLRPAAQLHDRLVGDAIARLLGLPDHAALAARPVQHAQVTLPPALGGLGIRPMESILDSAYVASWQDSRQTMIDRVQTEDLRRLLLRPDGAGWERYQPLRELLDAHARLRTAYDRGEELLARARQDYPWAVTILQGAGRLLAPAQPPDAEAEPGEIGFQGVPEITPLTVSDDPGTLPMSRTDRQRHLTTVVERTRFLQLTVTPDFFPHRDRLLSATGQYASAFLNALPKISTIGTPWQPGHFRTCLQLRCGLDLTTISQRPQVPQCTCVNATPIRPDGGHCLTCPKYRLPTKRHDLVCAALTACLHYAQVPGVRREQRTHLRPAGDRLRVGYADIHTAGWPTRQGRQLAIDVTIAQPHPGAAQPGHAAAAAERRKEQNYQHPLNQNTEFMPFAIEQHGRLGPKALDLIRRISLLPSVTASLQDQGYRTHNPETNEPYTIVYSIPRNWMMQRISTALMQGQAECVHERLHRIDTANIPRQFRHMPGLVQGEILRP